MVKRACGVRRKRSPSVVQLSSKVIVSMGDDLLPSLGAIKSPKWGSREERGRGKDRKKEGDYGAG